MKASPKLWLLCSTLHHPEIAYVIPTVAWMARAVGAKFESYLESEREGRLFAETGSTVIGGHHHQQFNYLCAAYDVALVRLGRTAVFDSSVHAFGLPVLADANTPAALYRKLLALPNAPQSAGVFLGPSRPVVVGRHAAPLNAYLFPEVLHRRALAGSSRQARALGLLASQLGLEASWGAFLAPAELQTVRRSLPRLRLVDALKPNDTWGSVTLRLAHRWKKQSRGVVFGDPPAVLSQLAAHCERDCVAVYAPVAPRAQAATEASHYVESTSPIARETAALAVELGNRTITGRQTGDGDIFEWSNQGVSIQIVDPNRPPFPAVAEITHPWRAPLPGTLETEPTDAQLRVWAREAKVLTSLVFHSGEVAHNEAMLAVIELTAWTGLKLGLGVHAARYETCPQMWELIGLPTAHGGARGRVEPLLHSGGLGVMAECNCPPALLRENCKRALERIGDIAGEANKPRGYYAFMDSNVDRLNRVRGDLYTAVADAGLRYVVSSALPGRNRVLWRDHTGCLAINQSPRVVHGASPFVRATTPEDLHTVTGAAGAGWILATLDAPVISFAPYIWRHGGRFLRLIEEELRGPGRINVTPGTIARYARLLAEMELLPAPVARGTRTVTYRA